MNRRIKVSLAILAAFFTGCSGTYNSKLEAEIASYNWEQEGGSITIETPKVRYNSRQVTINLTEKEYQEQLQRNREATKKYIDEVMKPKWEEADKKSKKMLLAKYPYLSSRDLDDKFYINYPEEQKFYWNTQKSLEPKCKETSAIVCVAHRKIRTKFPERIRSFTNTKKEEYIKSDDKPLRSCHVELETRQYICRRYQFKDGSKITQKDWINRKSNYHYFRY